ncbi:MAG: hypothetical protein AAGF19_09100, partial [Pseudomonadota bacterium]
RYSGGLVARLLGRAGEFEHKSVPGWWLGGAGMGVGAFANYQGLCRKSLAAPLSIRTGYAARGAVCQFGTAWYTAGMP